MPEYYRPNSGGDVEALPARPSTHQRPHTHEDDATVALRRCGEPLPNTRTLWLKTPRRLRVEPLELEVAQPLPDVCAAHGLPAVSRRSMRNLFYDTDQHPRFHRSALERDLTKRLLTLRSAPTASVSTIVESEWPVCARCARVSARYRFLARTLLVLMAVDLVAVVVVSIAGIHAVLVPLVLGLFPGSIPLGLMLWVVLAGKSVRRVTFRPIYDERFAFVEAHPRFRAALEEMTPGRSRLGKEADSS